MPYGNNNSLASVLANIPGLAGWEASRQQRQQQQSEEVRQAQGLMQILGAVQAQQEKQKQAARSRQFQAEIAAAPPEQRAEIAARYEGPSGILKHADTQQRMADTKAQRQAEIEYRYDNLARMEASDRQRASDAAASREQRDEASRRADETRRLLINMQEEMRRSGQDRAQAVVGVDANGNQVVNWARPSQGAQTFQTRPPSLTTSSNQQAISLRRAYDSNPEVKLANSLEPRVAPMAQYVAEVGQGMGNAVGDAELVKLWLMTTHPKGDQISNMDYRTIEKMPDLWGRVKNLTGNFVFGKTLDADTRGAMWRSISEKWKATDASRKRYRADTVGRGRNMGIGEELIFAPTQE